MEIPFFSGGYFTTNDVLFAIELTQLASRGGCDRSHSRSGTRTLARVADSAVAAPVAQTARLPASSLAGSLPAPAVDGARVPCGSDACGAAAG
jgi:hypothetical protein